MAFEEGTGVRVEIAFGGCEDHLPHVRAHDVGDIYIAHTPYMRYTENANASVGWVHVGYISPVLVVKKGNSPGIKRIEDLAIPGLKVALPNPEYSTCGEMLKDLLEKKGIWEDVEKNTGNAFFRTHAQVATAIDVGGRDTGVIWNGVAHNWLGKFEIVHTPYEYDQVIEVGVIGLGYSEHPELVEEFLKFTEKNGEAIFKKFGYTKSASNSSGEEKKSLFIHSGAGLRPPVSEVAETFSLEYGVDVDCNYAGSGGILNQIQLTKKGDLFIPGDVSYIDLAEAGGLVISRHEVCYNIPVILVKKGNPKGIKGIEDLVKPGIKLGLGNPEAIPVGRNAVKIFEENGIKIEDVNKNIVFSALTVNELGIQIKVGKIDAAIVWDGTAHQFADSADIVEIPGDNNVVSTVAIALLACSEDYELAQEFVDFITSERGQQIFRKYHYSTEAPE
ncbi:MAG: molybdate ABC transporter substrate-binding protein [Euryarchaeota archaeon]|nr:molybdate ABC transporter substrate-binding protein [Euryarchaeota archaeon]